MYWLRHNLINTVKGVKTEQKQLSSFQRPLKQTFSAERMITVTIMIFVRGCISSQHGNSLFDPTVQFLKPPILVENTGQWCCQSGFSCQIRWHITANISVQVEWSGRVFIGWSKHLHTHDVQLSVEGVTDGYVLIKDFKKDQNPCDTCQLFRSLSFSTISVETLILTLTTTFTHLICFVQFPLHFARENPIDVNWTEEWCWFNLSL